MAAENKFFESYKKAVTTAASVAASMMLVRTVVNEVIPYELRDYVFSRFDVLRSRLSSQHTIVIDQAEGYASNLVFDAARTYLSTRINRSMRSLRVSMVEEGKSMVVSLEPGEEMIDVYQGIEFKWQLISQQVERSSIHTNSRFSGSATESRSFVVSFHQKHKDKILHSYLPFILEQAKAIREQDRTLQLHMNEGDGWCPVNLHHPSTFDTLAMDPKLKAAVMEDLARFVKRRDYYSRIGKAWKRGYLLYGPPGTGKSSLIAAMANYLKFDIYDLELAEVNWNNTLRRLLVGMSNRSILVVEDIDCSVDLQKRDERGSDDTSPSTSNDDKITLSGLLNFIDGLWSTSGEERIIVLTTNFKDRLDPALLRPGRMDMHIHMGYCGPHAFRVLASNYHAIDEHNLFADIEGLIREVEVTPAEVAEQLMRSDDADTALEGLLEYLRGKKKDASEAKKMETEA
ncbi:ATPase family associated with various cellular activities (AAA) [Musa troglodytarum]|uniref:ATPase family associated with various cellular activities (AAA) n=1 Tax=Musa troglodytarum TaxID=320322 RepID=A0A9E7K0Z1_9LILI|nr:ATPase family associated with various cellular activities (AAA) [Musa troglodytarum]